MHRYSNAVLLVFCKTPLLGRVKTRLTPQLSPEAALEVHLELSRRTLQTAVRDALCPVELWAAPTLAHPFFADAAARYGVSLHEQQGADLGERMRHALTDGLQRYRKAVLIGTDCPSLTGPTLERAIRALDDDVAVFAPAEDGGYTLIGLQRPLAEIFENMPWGSDRVMETTRRRLAALGQPHRELDLQWDVDTAEDYRRYLGWKEITR